MNRLDLFVKNVRLVRPQHSDTPTVALGVTSGVKVISRDPSTGNRAGL